MFIYTQCDKSLNNKKKSTFIPRLRYYLQGPASWIDFLVFVVHGGKL